MTDPQWILDLTSGERRGGGGMGDRMVDHTQGMGGDDYEDW